MSKFYTRIDMQGFDPEPITVSAFKGSLYNNRVHLDSFRLKLKMVDEQTVEVRVGNAAVIVKWAELSTHLQNMRDNFILASQ